MSASTLQIELNDILNDVGALLQNRLADFYYENKKCGDIFRQIMESAPVQREIALRAGGGGASAAAAAAPAIDLSNKIYTLETENAILRTQMEISESEVKTLCEKITQLEKQLHSYSGDNIKAKAALDAGFEVVEENKLGIELNTIEEKNEAESKADEVEANKVEADEVEAEEAEAEEAEAEEEEAEEAEAEEVEAEEAEAEAEEAEAEEVEAEEVEAEEVEAEEVEAEEVESEEVEAKEVEAKEVEAKEVEAKEVEAKEVEAEEVEAEEVEAEEVEAEEEEAEEEEAEEVEAEEEEAEEEEAEEEEEIEYVEIAHKGKTYITADIENGEIYEYDEDGEANLEIPVGKLTNGKVKLYKKA